MSPQGLCPVYLRVTIKRVVQYFNLHINISPHLFDENKMRVKGNNDYANNCNIIISEALRKAEDYKFECLKEKKDPTFKEFKEFYYGNRLKDKTDVFEFMKHYIDINRHLYSNETIRTYTSQLTKLKKFKSEITFFNINDNFIKQYERYMKEVLVNKPNTYYKSMSFLKSVCELAVREEIIDKNPFKNYKIKKEPGEREFLNETEFKQLLRLFFYPEEKTISKNEHYVLFYFLFSCLTGLRFSDIQNLKRENFKDGNIELYQGKTKTKVIIPLSNLAKELLSLISEFDSIHPKVKIFKTFTNQSTNRILKRIAIIAGINKKLTYHVARHTFATLSISLDVPIYVLKEMLGHKDIKTTQIYAKVSEQKRNKEIEKWNNLDF